MYQTIVIGGGPSGAMAAVAASEKNKSVLLIEKKKGLGRKLKISGGGRCNVTNRLPYDEIIKKYDIKTVRKINFEVNEKKEYNDLSESKKKLYDFFTKNK